MSDVELPTLAEVTAKFEAWLRGEIEIESSELRGILAAIWYEYRRTIIAGGPSYTAIAALIEREREECAKLADKHAAYAIDEKGKAYGRILNLAAAIRERGPA